MSILLRATELLTYLNDTLIQRSSFLAQRLSQRVCFNPEKTVSESNALALVLCGQIFLHVPNATYSLKDYVELKNIDLQVQRSNI